jgi:hypothetical protein
MDPTPDWIERFRELLCAIYEEWGGDCDDLGFGATEWIDTLQDKYDTVGAPAFTNEAARTAYLAKLTELDTHLDKPGNSLSASDDGQIRALSANLRSDVTAQGS